MRLPRPKTRNKTHVYASSAQAEILNEKKLGEGKPEKKTRSTRNQKRKKSEKREGEKKDKKLEDKKDKKPQFQCASATPRHQFPLSFNQMNEYQDTLS